MSARIYVEGGGDSKDARARCREGFSKLLKKCGFRGRLPRLVACGGRTQAYDDFTIAHAQNALPDYVALLIDSEDPVPNINEPWNHLRDRDEWNAPPGARNDQVLLMTTCMETWIASDHNALSEHFGQNLQVAALPALPNIENRTRQDVLRSLRHATRDCPGCYTKGPKSYEIVGKLDPEAIEPHLPSFGRTRRILDEKLRPAGNPGPPRRRRIRVPPQNTD